MTAKEYLSQIQQIELRIQQQKETLEMLRYAATSTTARIDTIKVQSSSNHDRIGEAVVKMADLENKIQEEIADAFYRKHEILNQIQGLNKSLYISILFKRYLQFIRFEDIAEELSYSYQYIVEMHGKALKAFEKKYQNILQE